MARPPQQALYADQRIYQLVAGGLNLRQGMVYTIQQLLNGTGSTEPLMEPNAKGFTATGTAILAAPDC